jgi:hypothetical protein
MTPPKNSATETVSASDHRRLTPLAAIDPCDATALRSTRRLAMSAGRPAARPMTFNSAL